MKKLPRALSIASLCLFSLVGAGYQNTATAQTYLTTPNYFGNGYTSMTTPNYMGGWVTESYRTGPSAAELLQNQTGGNHGWQPNNFWNGHTSVTRPNYMGGWITESYKTGPSAADLVHRNHQ